MKAVARMVVVASALLAGCGSKSLQKLDGGSGGIGRIDGGGGVIGDGGQLDGGGTIDGGGGAVDRPPAWDVSFTGRRSFVVTATVFTSASGSVTSHAFTLTLLPDQQKAIVGVPGGAEI